MIEGISPTTLNRYRVEDNVLKFMGRSHDSNILQYEVNVGDDEDAYFAAEFLSGKMKNFVLLSQDLNIMRGLVEEDVQINKSAWNTISFGVYVVGSEGSTFAESGISKIDTLDNATPKYEL